MSYAGTAALRRAGGLGNIPQSDLSPVINESSVEVPAGTAAGTVFLMDRIPLSARIHGFSSIGWDALSTGTGTLTVGLREFRNGGVKNDDVLQSGIDVTSAATTALSLVEISDWGKTAAEHLGLESDDGVAEVVIATATDAADAGGTVTVALVYSVD